MPKIAQYEAPEGLGLRPTSLGTDSTAAAARRVQGEYTEAAAAQQGTGERIGSAIKVAGDIGVKAIEHHEVNRGAAAYASFVNAKTQEWNEIAKNADPNDPTVGQRFIEQNLNPQLDKFKDGFLTEGAQKWAETHVEQFRQHMTAKTSADMSTLAGQAAVTNSKQTINNLASTAYRDPSSLDFALKTLETTTEGIIGSSPTLSADDAGKVRTQLLQAGKQGIVKSAVMGMIERNPDVDLDKIQKKYGEYLTPGEMQQFAKAAKSQAKADLYYQKAAEQYQHTQDVRAADAGFSKIWSDSVSFDDNGKPTIKPEFFKNIMEIEKQYPGAATERARSMINWGQAQQREKREVIVTDPATQSSLYDGLFRTENPTTDVDILKASAQNKLDAHATSTLMGLYRALEERPLKGPLYQTAMEAVKEKLGTNVVGDGHGRYSQFMQQFIPAYLALPEKERIGALDSSNPNSLISKIIGTKPGEGLRPSQPEMVMGKYLKNLGIGVEATPETLQKLQEGLTPPASDKLPAIPEPSKRVTGRLYQTPNGPRIWTGTAWKRPE